MTYHSEQQAKQAFQQQLLEAKRLRLKPHAIRTVDDLLNMPRAWQRKILESIDLNE